MSATNVQCGNYTIIDAPMNPYYRDLKPGVDYGATTQRCVQLLYKGEFFADLILPAFTWGENAAIILEALNAAPDCE